MNYSEMVGRYAAKIEWSQKPMGWTTACMIEYGKNHPKWLVKHKNASYNLNEEIFSYGEDIRE